LTDDAYESTLRLIRHAKAGDKEAMERIVVENDALVRYIIGKYRDCGKEYEDLYQLGRIGLVRAVENFDESFSVRFSTYAFPMILGEVRRFLRDDGQMRISRTIREHASILKKCSMKIEEETGRRARIAEITEMSGLDREEVLLALGSMKPVRSLSEPLEPGGEILIQDTVGVNPFEDVEKNLLVQKLISNLNEKEQKLIRMRYFERCTQSRVAEELGLTQVQVSRLEKKLLLRMRENAV